TPMREIAFVEERSGVFAGVLQETCLATFVKKPSRAKLRVATVNGHRRVVGQVPRPLPGSGMPWLLPRRRSDSDLVSAAGVLPNTLASVGWKASTGPLVWNRRKKDLHPSWAPGRAAVVFAADIDGGRLHWDERRDRIRWLELRSQRDEETLVLRRAAIAVQRTTSPEQARRLVAAE
ncbi:hypothetical protein B7486_77415, partial [cyanobacterium TDX16]